MKQAQHFGWMLPAILFLSVATVSLRAQTYEQNVTTRLIVGAILNADDEQPIEQVSVELWAAGKPVATTVTGWSGEFCFSGLAPGEYLISVEQAGGKPLWEKVQADVTAARVTLRLKKTSAANEYTASFRNLSIPPAAQTALRDGVNSLKSDPPGAMASLQRAIALFPSYYEAYYFLGMANLMMERQDEAAGALRQSIELSKGSYVRALMALGAVLCDQEKFVEAESVIRKGVEIDDTPWIGHLLMARALVGLGRWDEAEANANAAVLRQPEVSDAYLLLAHIHSRRNNPAAVLDDLDEFLKLEPDGDISDQARKLRDELSRRVGPVEHNSAALTSH